MVEFPKLLISGDYNVFNEGWNGHGVYMASGLYKSNVFCNPIYIGSAAGEYGLMGRIEYQHIPSLNKNGHKHNQPLQNGWNKHGGSDGFVWWLLEICAPKDCLKTEQKYLDFYRPFVDEFGGFNIGHFSSSGLIGREQSQEEIKSRIDKSTASRISKNSFRLISPSGCLTEFKNVYELERVNQFKKGSLASVLSGRVKHHNGWRKYDEQLIGKVFDPDDYKIRIISCNLNKSFELVDSNGVIFSGPCLFSFCKERQFPTTVFSRILRDLHSTYFGWRKATTNTIGVPYILRRN